MMAREDTNKGFLGGYVMVRLLLCVSILFAKEREVDMNRERKKGGKKWRKAKRRDPSMMTDAEKIMV